MTQHLERRIHFSPSQTKLAIRQLHDEDDRVRMSSARYLSLLCAPKNRHYMTEEVEQALEKVHAVLLPRVQESLAQAEGEWLLEEPSAPDPSAAPLLPSATLAGFRLEGGLPVWRYECGRVALEKRLLMPHEQNTVHVLYSLLPGSEPAELTLLGKTLLFTDQASWSDADRCWRATWTRRGPCSRQRSPRGWKAWPPPPHRVAQPRHSPARRWPTGCGCYRLP